MTKSRPLEGVKIIEFAGIGPAPFCGMLLSDLGADVVRIDHPNQNPRTALPVMPITGRGRRSIALDLKTDEGRDTALSLITKAEAIFEGFRPGVMERLGLGPDEAMAANPKLVYGRMTGWGQTGPLAHAAGHDINYIALAGALGSMGREGEPPTPPLNLVGDYGGGAMFLAVGLLAGILKARATGEGHVVDAAMTDGTALLMSLFHDLNAAGLMTDKRYDNVLDGGAPFYDTYECSDGKYIAIGAIEPQFYKILLEQTGLTDDSDFANQMDKKNWPSAKTKLAEIIKQKSRDEWCAIMEGSDVCFAPVLSMLEAPGHEHNRARETFIEFGNMIQPGAVPRFDGVSHHPTRASPKPGEHTEQVLKEWLG